MMSILEEIYLLRKEKPFLIDSDNTNRYSVILHDDSETNTAYCFGAPIYNERTRKLVNMKFRENGSLLYGEGSNANITVSSDIRLENARGFCIIHMNSSPIRISERELQLENGTVSLTTNGVLLKMDRGLHGEFSFDLDVAIPFMEPRANTRSFSLMIERFRPFVTVSCIGTANREGEIISPALISYRKENDRRYRLSCSSCGREGKYILLEINLHEPKLFLDTTVESKNPKSNNAFGSMAFIGNTYEFGEQWLYSRIDLSKLQYIMDKPLVKAVLHLKRLNSSDAAISVFNCAQRFCSFGSTWDNKIPYENSSLELISEEGYRHMDITSLITEPETGYAAYSEGFILKPEGNRESFAAIPTGDSCYAPQIIEIQYKK